VKPIRIVGVLVLLLFLAGCSSTTFVYNRLDFLIPWNLDDYVDLNNAQEEQLDELLVPFLQWHRMQELPIYVEVLDQISNDLDQTVTVQELDALSESFEQAAQRLQDRGLQWMFELGEQLSREQIQEFITELRERQQDYEKKYLPRSDKEFREESYERLLDSVQDYMGRLDREQRAVLRDASEQMLRSDTIWLAERAAWLDELEILLQRQPGWQQQVRLALETRSQNPSPEYTAVYDHNRVVIETALLTIINGRTDKQDNRLRSEISELREDLQILIEQGREAGA
tara:strand:+ start:237789 stop:238643 length:855 start_codon:yes stop_codon:yes gene_type:complete